MKELRVIHVQWIDSETDDGWEGLPDDQYLRPVHTIGILLKEAKDHILISNSFDPDSHFSNGRIVIPLCAIKNVRTICHIKL